LDDDRVKPFALSEKAFSVGSVEIDDFQVIVFDTVSSTNKLFY